jgi:hypothetical protein
VLKALHCYEQESCDQPSWPHSSARRVMERLMAAVFDRHPELGELLPSRSGITTTVHAYRQHPLYWVMPWPFSQLEDAAAYHYPEHAPPS